MKEEEKTASIEFSSEEVPDGLCLEQQLSPEHVRIVNDSPPDSVNKMLKPYANTFSPISPLKESVVGKKARRPLTFRNKK
jgi:hypothetical protein